MLGFVGRQSLMFRVACVLSFAFIYGLDEPFAQEGYPIPRVDRLLFYVQHNRGHNTVLYLLNLNKQGVPDRENPVIVRRQLFDEDNAIKPLTRIQNRFAYGVKGEFLNANSYAFRLAGYDDQLFLLDLDGKQGRVKTVVNGHAVFVTRMFLCQTEGTSGLNTTLDYILFFGRNSSNRSVLEKLNIK